MEISDTKGFLIAGDRPLDEDGVDLLGFTPLANRLAAAIIDGTTTEGLVIGIQGKWGSGKSSLISLTMKAMRDQSPHNAPSVLVFRPWIVGNRDALLTTLFTELADTIAKVKLEAGDAGPTTLRSIDATVEKLRTYGKRLGSLTPIAQLAEAVGVPYAGFLSKILKAAGKSSKAAGPKPLAELRKSLNRSIRELPCKIVVFVDDLDRLEPSEIAEMLRLVRSVADFENITYVLCYDEAVVAKAVQDTMKIVNGRAFLEKLVQVAVRIPEPEPFLLRRLLVSGLSEFANTNTDGEARRLNLVIDGVGHRVDTMRSVKRVLDAVRFAWPALDGRVDLADYVWLQITRATMPEVFNWAEDYLSDMSVQASGRAMVTPEGKKRSHDRLKKALEANETGFDSQAAFLSELLPGIARHEFSDAGKLPIYERQSPEEIAIAARDKRLSSPDHQRLYFALATPDGAVEENDYVVFAQALDEGVESAANVLNLFFDSGDYLTRKAEILISRLKDRVDYLTPERASRTILTLADTLDHKQAIRNFDELGGPPSWHEAEEWIRTCRRFLENGATSPTIRAFKHGKAMGWLTSLLRNETFSHGHFGDRRQPENKWLFSEFEYQNISEVMRDRYAQMSDEELLSVPSLPSLLFGWSQLGETEAVRERVDQLIRTDSNLVRYFESASSEISSTAGNYWHISKEVASSFTNVDQVRTRLLALTAGKSDLAERASELIKRLDNANRW